MLGLCTLKGCFVNYIVYIDGFNLFYRIKDFLKNPKLQNLKWLNVEKFCSKTMDRLNLSHKPKLVKIKYFTADIMENNQGSLQNQQAYLSALRTLNKVEIIKGKFKIAYPTGYRYDNDNRKLFEPKEKITIRKPEEKESDVNIAIHIINDCYEQKNLEGIVLISSDTDLCPVLKMVKEKFPDKKIIHVRMKEKDSMSMKKIADSNLRIRLKDIRTSQFTDTVLLTKKDKTIKIKKPKSW